MILLTVSSLKQKKGFWGETPNLETRISDQSSGKPWAFWPCKRGKKPANLSRRVPLLGIFFLIPDILCPIWVYCFFSNVNLANTKLKQLWARYLKCHLLPKFVAGNLLATQKELFQLHVRKRKTTPPVSWWHWSHKQKILGGAIFTLTWGNDPIWLIFFRWVETTNKKYCLLVYGKLHKKLLMEGFLHHPGCVKPCK